MRVLPRIDTDFDKGCAFGCLKIECLNDLETWFLKLHIVEKMVLL